MSVENVPFGKRGGRPAATPPSREAGPPSAPPIAANAAWLIAAAALAVLVAAGAVLALRPAGRRPAPVVPAADNAVYPTPETILAQFPNTRIVYYDVYGTDPGAIRRSIEANGIIDEHDGQKGGALTAWTINWAWPGGANCGLSYATATFQATVTLPRLTTEDRLPADLAAAWRRYMSRLATHEAGHVEHAYVHMTDVVAALRNSTCASAGAAGAQAIEELRRYDHSYDVATRHGLAQGARFP